MCEKCNSKTWQGKLNSEKWNERMLKQHTFYPANALPQQKEAEEREKARRFNITVNGSNIEKGEVGFDKFGNMYFWRNGAWEFKGNFYNDGAMPKNLNT